MDKLENDYKICSNILVALCTCEGSFFLPAQLESIMGQSLLPGKLVVCDDASTDNTVEILEAFKDKAPFEVKLCINEKRLGVVQNFSRAIELCRGRYVALCDQDDTWLPEKLAVMMNRMVEAENKYGQHIPILVHSDLRVINKSGTEIAASFMNLRKLKPNPKEPLKTLLVQNYVTGCTVLINRPLIDAALPIPEKAILHDWWLALVASAVGKIVYEPRPTILYRRHGENVIDLNPFYAHSNLSRLTGREEFARNIAAMLVQAKALQERINSLVGIEPVVYLERFLDAAYQGGTKAAFTALQYNIGKAGFIRNTAFLAHLYRGEYLKCLKW